ncbi:putative DDB1-CUL4 associated factor [Paratrimastix pyriformis]|uniref:DDB1-CUL4 associated factor n=1 Tax=Paratrimastix pyriformis TaxID=342808 RepID=A0ABQ8UG83_9EUKA|nr:putative DDB1-CUL4 associated factor [Paratrimastix pyriformis]
MREHLTRLGLHEAARALDLDASRHGLNLPCLPPALAGASPAMAPGHSPHMRPGGGRVGVLAARQLVGGEGANGGAVEAVPVPMDSLAPPSAALVKATAGRTRDLSIPTILPLEGAGTHTDRLLSGGPFAVYFGPPGQAGFDKATQLGSGAGAPGAAVGHGPLQSLDEIVSQFLLHQHKNCSEPISVLPPFSLFTAHRCPAPRAPFFDQAHENFAQRTLDQSAGLRSGGRHGERLTRRLVYGRFNKVLTIREKTSETYFTCTTFTPDGMALVMGTESGELKSYDLIRGNCTGTLGLGTSESPVTVICHPTRALLAVSTLSQSLLVPASPLQAPVKIWEDCHAADFSSRGDRILAAASDGVRIYDTATGLLQTTLRRDAPPLAPGRRWPLGRFGRVAGGTPGVFPALAEDPVILTYDQLRADQRRRLSTGSVRPVVPAPMPVGTAGGRHVRFSDDESDDADRNKRSRTAAPSGGDDLTAPAASAPVPQGSDTDTDVPAAASTAPVGDVTTPPAVAPPTGFGAEEEEEDEYGTLSAVFSPCDQFVFSDGVLWDVRSGGIVHKVRPDRLQFCARAHSRPAPQHCRFPPVREDLRSTRNGLFHPNGLHLILESEVWDARTFQLVTTCPALKGADMGFTSGGSVIFAVQHPNPDSPELPDEAEQTFHTIDGSDYRLITSTNVGRTIGDLAIHPQDINLALIETKSRTVAGMDVSECECCVYGAGLTRPSLEDSGAGVLEQVNADEDEEDEEDDDDEDEDEDDEEEDDEDDEEGDLMMGDEDEEIVMEDEGEEGEEGEEEGDDDEVILEDEEDEEGEEDEPAFPMRMTERGFFEWIHGILDESTANYLESSNVLQGISDRNNDPNLLLFIQTVFKLEGMNAWHFFVLWRRQFPPVAAQPAPDTAGATFPAAMPPPGESFRFAGSPADTPWGSPTAEVISDSRAPDHVEQAVDVGPANGPPVPVPTPSTPTPPVQSKSQLLELVVSRLLADRLSSPHANPWVAPERQPDLQSRSRAIPRLDRQGRPILDDQGEPMSWTPDFLCRVRFHNTRPVNLFEQFVDSAPRDVPRPTPQPLLRISQTAPQTTSTPASNHGEGTAYVMGECTTDSTTIRTQLRKLRLGLSGLVRYKTLAPNDTPGPASTRGRTSPPPPASMPSDDEIARILSKPDGDDDENVGLQFPDHPLISVAFLALNDPPTPADLRDFLAAAKDMGLGDLLTRGRLRLRSEGRDLPFRLQGWE